MLPIPKEIINQQSLAVDTVSGATYTSNGILAAAEQALLNAGGDIAALKTPAKEKELAQGKDEQVDVVIVGGGLAGLMAGVELQRNHPDLTFTIVEQLPVFGGSLPTTGGAVFATDSKWHKEQGAVSTVDDVVQYLKESSKEAPLNEQLIKNVFSLSGETFDWYVDFGVPFEKELALSTTHSNKLYVGWTQGRTNGGGADFYKTLARALPDLNMDIRLNSKATDLIVENGIVKGINVEDSQQRYNIYAEKVILTTGGFANNSEYMAKYAPKFADGIITTYAGSNGDGFHFVEQFGTKVVGDGTMGTFYASNGKTTQQMPFMVTSEGKRFVNESDLSYRMQRVIADDANGRAFQIVDSQNSKIDAVKQAEQDGIWKKYGSIADLAKDLGINEANLQKEIENYNTAITNNQSPGFGLPVEKAEKIQAGPFYAGEVVVRTFSTIPGIQVSSNMQVLDSTGTAVPNLYAAGELTAGNIFSHQYPGAGFGLSYASNSGRFVAKQVADSIK